MGERILKRKKRLPKNVVPYSVFLQRLKAKEFASKVAEAKERKMPFGKYKGTRLSDVPYSYLSWLVGQDWLPQQHPNLSEHVEAVYNGINEGVIPKAAQHLISDPSNERR